MRRSTKFALIAGGTTAVAAGGAIARGRLAGHGPQELPPEAALFDVYAPGGRYGFLANGPIGWVLARLGPYSEAGVHASVAEALDLQPDDEVLDIGCGSGAFLATKAQRARRVVGLDPSRTMLREAERRLGDRLAAGTARLVLGRAPELPFDDGEFSAVTAIFAPASHAEVFRVLRPGGRFVFVDDNPRRSAGDPRSGWGRRRYDEADHGRMLDEAGFTDLDIRRVGGYLLAHGRKPVVS